MQITKTILFYYTDDDEILELRGNLEKLDDPFIIKYVSQYSQFKLLLEKGGVNIIVATLKAMSRDNFMGLKIAGLRNHPTPVILIADANELDAPMTVKIMKFGTADILFDRSTKKLVNTIDVLLQSIDIRNLYRESHDVYRSLFQENHAVILVVDPANGDIVDANNAACRFYEYNHAKLVSMNIAELNMLTKAEIKREMQRAKTEQRKHFYFKHCISSGEVRDVEVYSGPIELMGKTFLYSLIHDISDKKLTEQMLIKSQQRYALAAKAGKTGVWEIYPHQKKIYTDSNLKSLFGYQDDELFDDFEDWKKILGEDDYQTIIEKINDIASGIYSEYSLNTIVIKRNGEKTWFRHSAKLVPSDDPDEVRIIGSSTDITLQKKVEDKLNDYRLHLEKMVDKRTGELEDINKKLEKEIAERKAAEKQLRQNELIFRTLAESTSAGVIIVNEMYKSIYVNPAAMKITGYELEEFTELYITDIITTENRAKNIPQMSFSKDEFGGVDPKEMKIMRKDGALRWISISGGFVSLGDQESIIITFFDITDRKILENQLQKSKKEYERIVSSVPNTIYSLKSGGNKQQQYFYISPSIQEITGKPDSYYTTSDKLQELFHPDDQIIAMKYRELIYNDEIENFSFEHRLLLPDGKIKWLQQEGRVEYFEDGTFRIDGVMVDVTERHISEEALKESEKKFRELAENINEIFWIEENGSIIYVSPAYERFWRKSVDSLYHNPVSFLSALHPADKRKMLRAISSEDYEKYRKLSEEFRVRWSGEEMRWIWARSFLTKKSNSTIRSVGIAEDISLRKRAEEEIQAALDKSSELHELKSRLVSMVSHEFRTPLSVISSSVEILKDFSTDLDEKQKEDQFQNIDKAIRSFTELLDDIIMINRADLGKVNINYEPIEIIAFLTHLFQQTRSNSGMHVKADFKANVESAIIRSDKKLLRQVFINLLTNAFKYTAKGKSVECELKVERDNFTLSIRDEGIGIPASTAYDIFEPFSRAENVENRSGSGLGLAIVKRYVSLLKGTISYESTLNKGSTFFVSIPL